MGCCFIFKVHNSSWVTVVNSTKTIFPWYMVIKFNNLSKALIIFPSHPILFWKDCPFLFNRNGKESLAALWGMALALAPPASCFWHLWFLSRVPPFSIGTQILSLKTFLQVKQPQSCAFPEKTEVLTYRIKDFLESDVLWVKFKLKLFTWVWHSGRNPLAPEITCPFWLQVLWPEDYAHFLWELRTKKYKSV